MTHRHVLKAAGGIALAVVLLTCFGPFVNEDYEKISANSKFLSQGNIVTKFFSPEAGYEEAYYRPLTNAALFAMAKIFGTHHAAPYRAAGALVFAAAVAAVYWAGRKSGLSERMALVCAAVFAVHPFNSWFIFQGSWLGNSLMLVFMALSWAAYQKGVHAPRGHVERRALVLALCVWAAAASKDSGVLFAVLLFPAAYWGEGGTRRRRLLMWAAAVGGAGAYLLQRAFVVETHGMFTASRTFFALSQAGPAALQYVYSVLTGDNFNYARPLHVLAGGWYLTLPFTLGLIAAIRWLRFSKTAAFLLWGIAVSWAEIVTGSIVAHELVASRAVLSIAFGVLLAGYGVSRLPRNVLQGRLLKAALAAVLIFFTLQSGRHVWASLDAGRFYAFHNDIPYNWKTLFVEGRIAYDAGDLEHAERAFNESLKISPRMVTHHDLALTLERLGRPPAEVNAQYRAALADAPDDPMIHNNLGYALEQQGDLQGALLHYLSAFGYREKDRGYSGNLIRVLRQMAGDDNPTPEYIKLMDRMPGIPRLHNELGYMLASQGLQKIATLHFRLAVSLDPTYAIAYNNLGLSLAAQGEEKAALRSFEEAVRLRPDYAKAHNNLGIALARAGKIEEAAAHFRKAVESDPRFESAVQNLSAAEQEIKSGASSQKAGGK